MDRVVKASLSIDPIPAACDTASTTPSSSVVPGDTVGRAVRRLAIGGVEPDGMGTSSMHSIRRPPTSGAHRAEKMGRVASRLAARGESPSFQGST